MPSRGESGINPDQVLNLSILSIRSVLQSYIIDVAPIHINLGNATLDTRSWTKFLLYRRRLRENVVHHTRHLPPSVRRPSLQPFCHRNGIRGNSNSKKMATVVDTEGRSNVFY